MTVDINKYFVEYYRFLTGDTLEEKKRIKCINPMHQDKRPSMVFYTTRTPHLYCFGCQRLFNIYDIGSILAGKSPEEVETDIYTHIDPSADPQKIKDLSSWMLMILNEITDMASQELNTKLSLEGRSYLAKKGINQELCMKYSIGHINKADAFINRLKQKISDDTYAQIDKHFYIKNNLRNNSIIFPLKEGGKTIGLCTRLLDDKTQKYISSKNSILFQKKKFLYNNQVLKNIKEDTIYLTEGITDSIKLSQEGFKAVSPLGLNISTEQMDQIKESQVRKIYMIFDPDDAGVKAFIKFIDTTASVGHDLKYYTVYGLDTDVDEYIQREGSQGIRKLIKENTYSWSEYYAAFGPALKKRDQYDQIIKTLAMEEPEKFEAISKILSQSWQICNKEYKPDQDIKQDLIHKKTILINEKKKKLEAELCYYQQEMKDLLNQQLNLIQEVK